MSLKTRIRDRLPAPLLLLVRKGLHLARDSTLRLLVALRLQQKAFGRVPDLVHPEHFTDKIRWRMLYDRRPLLQMCSDRLAARDYVAKRAGDKYLVPLLGVFDRPEQIPWAELPPPYVVKPTHGSGWSIFVRDSGDVDPERFQKKLEEWLRTNYYHFFWEWSYKQVPRRIIVERFIGLDGNVPEDFKFHCFDGEPQVVTVCRGRFTSEEGWTVRDPSWNVLTVFHGKYPPGPPASPPPGFAEMTELARALSEGFDFIRVDLYCVEDRVYFGELTPTPNGGERLFSEGPGVFLGAFWRLPSRAALRRARGQQRRDGSLVYGRARQG